MAYEGMRKGTKQQQGMKRGLGSVGSKEEREKNKKKRREKKGIGGFSRACHMGNK